MVSQSQLRSLSRTEIRKVAASEQEQQSIAGQNKKSQAEYERQVAEQKRLQEEYDKQVAEQEADIAAKQEAYDKVAELVNTSLRRSPGFIEGSGIQRAKEYFRRAGLPESQGEQLYLQGVKGSVAYQAGKQYAESKPIELKKQEGLIKGGGFIKSEDIGKLGGYDQIARKQLITAEYARKENEYGEAQKKSQEQFKKLTEESRPKLKAPSTTIVNKAFSILDIPVVTGRGSPVAPYAVVPGQKLQKVSTFGKATSTLYLGTTKAFDIAGKKAEQIYFGGLKIAGIPTETISKEDKKTNLYLRETLTGGGPSETISSSNIIIPKGTKTSTPYKDIGGVIKFGVTSTPYLNPISRGLLLGGQFVTGAEQYRAGNKREGLWNIAVPATFGVLRAGTKVGTTYYKGPKIKTTVETIKVPVVVKQPKYVSTIGYQWVKIVTDKGVKYTFASGKGITPYLASGKEGYRVVVKATPTTFEKVLGFRPKTLYSGVPYEPAARTTYKKLPDIFGRSLYLRRPGTYQKTLSLFKRKGLTESQARQSLRFGKPLSPTMTVTGPTIVRIDEFPQGTPKVNLKYESKTTPLFGMKGEGATTRKQFKLYPQPIKKEIGIFRGEGGQKFTDYIGVRQTVRVTKKGGMYLKVSDLGKPEVTKGYLTRVYSKRKPIGPFEVKNVEYYDVRGYSKQIGKPRADITDTIVQLRKPTKKTFTSIVIKEKKPANAFFEFEMQPTSPIKTIQEGNAAFFKSKPKEIGETLKSIYKPQPQVVSLVKPSEVSISELDKILVREATSLSKPISQTEFPSMVGGKGLTTIPRAGKGTYEQTFGGILKGGAAVSSLIKPAAATKINVFQPTQTKIDTGLTTDLFSGSSSRFDMGVRLETTPITSLSTREATKPVQKVWTGLQTRQVTRQTTTQVPKLFTKLKTRQETRTPRVPKTPGLPPPPILPGDSDLVKALKRIGAKDEGVDIIVGIKTKKRKVIAKNLPPFKALKKAREYVDRNIEASFKLQPSKKKTREKDIAAFNVGPKFRPSKSTPLFVVEKKEFRNDSAIEQQELVKAQRKSPKKKGRKKKNTFGSIKGSKKTVWGKWF